MIKVDEASKTGSKHFDDATNYYKISNDEITITPEKYHDNVDKEAGDNIFALFACICTRNTEGFRNTM